MKWTICYWNFRRRSGSRERRNAVPPSSWDLLWEVLSPVGSLSSSCTVSALYVQFVRIIPHLPVVLCSGDSHLHFGLDIATQLLIRLSTPSSIKILDKLSKGFYLDNNNMNNNISVIIERNKKKKNNVLRKTKPLSIASWST